MSKRVALLHTSFVFFQRERLLFDLFEELLPDVELINIVEDKIHKQVMDAGRITPDVTRRMCYYVLAADAMGVNAVFNCCSSLGPTMDAARQLVNIPVIKIDEGMAEEAARHGDRIAVLATVPTTLKPNIDLIQEQAKQLGKTVSTREGLCAGAFELLMGGETERHDDLVASKAKELSSWADTLVLGQCSMARLAPRLSQETGRTVLASPRLGIMRLKKALNNGGRLS
jgi:Asp/Glu/hydantoin racemase